MLNFTVEIDINKGRNHIVALMHPDNLSFWAPKFVKVEHVSGLFLEEGSIYELYYKTGHVIYKITETFVTRRMPESFSCTFESTSCFQTSENWLEDLPNGQTRWRSTQSLRAVNLGSKGMIKFMPWMFKAQVKNSMNRFKLFAEAS